MDAPLFLSKAKQSVHPTLSPSSMLKNVNGLVFCHILRVLTKRSSVPLKKAMSLHDLPTRHMYLLGESMLHPNKLEFFSV
jgi:hypothetical protein